MNPNADSLVILDFETTGLSPTGGDRAIEIGAVKLVNGKVVEQFQGLMNPGFAVSSFIADYTGITNAMLQGAPSCTEVMTAFCQFIKGSHLVAHNASFDKRFLDAELDLLGLGYEGDFACSLLLARRLYQMAPNHKLGTLIQYKEISANGRFHRALYDAEMTAKLWLVMLEDIKARAGINSVPFSFVQKLASTPKKRIDAVLAEFQL